MRRCQVRITRIFNTYGPRLSASDGRIVSNVIVQALAGKAITVNGDGEQTRSFCYVSDLIEGLIRLMAFSGPQSGPITLGNPRELTINRSDERRVGKECVSTFRSRWSPSPKKK